MKIIKPHDAFISYAIEDKRTIAEPLAEMLRQRGYRIWFTGQELTVGDSISEVVNKGLRASRYGIVIVSPTYLRPWATYELFTLDSKEHAGKQKVILPVWHNITYQEVIRMYPKLSDRYAISTRNGLEAVCKQLEEALARGRQEIRQARLRKLGIAGILFACLSGISLLLYPHFMHEVPLPSREFIQATIEKRMEDQQRAAEHQLQEELATAGGTETTIDSITRAYNQFISLTDHERNSYSFSNGYSVITGRKNLHANGIPITAAPYDAYGMYEYRSCVLQNTKRFFPDTFFSYSFQFLNRMRPTFTIDTVLGNNEEARVKVSYSNFIRSVKGTLNYSKDTDHCEKRHLDIKGFKPSETYVFYLEDNTWELGGVE